MCRLGLSSKADQVLKREIAAADQEPRATAKRRSRLCEGFAEEVFGGSVCALSERRQGTRAGRDPHMSSALASRIGCSLCQVYHQPESAFVRSPDECARALFGVDRYG